VFDMPALDVKPADLIASLGAADAPAAYQQASDFFRRY
jgi:hypothetical protein